MKECQFLGKNWILIFLQFGCLTFIVPDYLKSIQKAYIDKFGHLKNFNLLRRRKVSDSGANFTNLEGLAFRDEFSKYFFQNVGTSLKQIFFIAFKPKTMDCVARRCPKLEVTEVEFRYIVQLKASIEMGNFVDKTFKRFILKAQLSMLNTLNFL